MATSSGASQSAGIPAPRSGRLRSVIMILLARTFAYGRRHRKKADRMVAAGALVLPGQAQPPALKVTRTDQT